MCNINLSGLPFFILVSCSHFLKEHSQGRSCSFSPLISSDICTFCIGIFAALLLSSYEAHKSERDSLCNLEHLIYLLYHQLSDSIIWAILSAG